MVNGFNIDELFTKAQTVLITVPSTTGSDVSLAVISTTIRTISSKNAAQSADNDKEESINYNDMPKHVCEKCHRKNDLVKIITKRHLIIFNQN